MTQQELHPRGTSAVPARAISFALLFFLSVLLVVPAEAQVRCRPATGLAASILAGDSGWGDLPIQGFYALDPAAFDEGRLVATVTVGLNVKALRAARVPRLGTFCAAVLADTGGVMVTLDERHFEIPELKDRQTLSSVDVWLYNVHLQLPEDASQVMVVLQEPNLATYGAFMIEEASEEAPRPSPASVQIAGGGPNSLAWYDVLRGQGARKDTSSRVVVRLVPPRRQPATGRTRFDALTTSMEVDKVVFELDGEQVEEERRRPFVGQITLANPPRPQTVRAIAYDANGRVIGEDSSVVNLLDVPFRVRISSFAQTSDAYDVAAQVSVPPGSELDRVELYLNESLIETFGSPPYQGSVPSAGVGPEDYVRIAAFLTDGSSIDDVVLLASPGLVEQVDVNLVELHVVVSDKNRRPVGDLALPDFNVMHRGQSRQIESFAYADDVPLLLGVVVDTSGSMQMLMQDTKKAAAKFIGETVLPKDRAFVVDFDRQPRLRQETTADVTDLMLSLSLLQANGATAMYDAIIFSMLQYERQPGRKALVVLTDGDDHDSRYGPKDCMEFGQRLGVPIYVIGLGALDSFRRSYSTKDLDRVTSRTGGRLYFVESLQELAWAYAEINAELRSQYSLTFYADSDLSDEERRKVEVRLKKPDLKARTVLGTTSTGQ